MRKMYNLFKCIIKSGGILYEIYDKQMELVAESNDVTTLQSKIREEYQMWIKRKASGDMIYFDEIDYDKENNNYFAYTSYNEERAMTYSIRFCIYDRNGIEFNSGSKTNDSNAKQKQNPLHPLHPCKDKNVAQLCVSQDFIQEFFEKFSPDTPTELRQELFYYHFHDYFHDHQYRISPEWIAAQTRRSDSNERFAALYESLYDAIVTDQEDWYKKGMDIAAALMKNNATELLIALCGWSALSLAKRAFLMRGYVDYNYEDIEGKLMVEWSDGIQSSANCVINGDTHEVTDYNPSIFKREDTSKANITKLFVRFDPFETGNEYDFLCVSKEERDNTADDDIFWYEYDGKN